METVLVIGSAGLNKHAIEGSGASVLATRCLCQVGPPEKNRASSVDNRVAPGDDRLRVHAQGATRGTQTLKHLEADSQNLGSS